jgi:hypothetical protein
LKREGCAALATIFLRGFLHKKNDRQFDLPAVYAFQLSTELTCVRRRAIHRHRVSHRRRHETRFRLHRERWRYRAC